MKFQTAFITGVTVFHLTAFSAVKSGLGLEKPSLVQKNQIIDYLKLPLAQRIQKIGSLGPQGYRILTEMAFSSNYTMDQRWKSFYVLTRIGKDKSLPEIKRALADKEWFLRSSALTALAHTQDDSVVKESQRLFESDDSLMVRATALDVMSLHPKALEVKLLERMYFSDKNSYKGRSLWIRRRILKTLLSLKAHDAKKAVEKIARIEKDNELKSIAQKFQR